MFFIVDSNVLEWLECHVDAEVHDALHGEPASVAVLDFGVHVDVAQAVERQEVLSLCIDADALDAGLRRPGLGQRIADLDVFQTDVRSVVEEQARILLFVVVVDFFS